MPTYDPFSHGSYRAGVRTVEVHDAERSCTLPCEIWYPADPDELEQSEREARCAAGAFPFVVFSHSSGSGRRQSTFLCTHLASHGYIVAAVDHAELVIPALARAEDEPPARREERQRAWIANRVPDVTAVLGRLLRGAGQTEIPGLDVARVGVVGHSFGGWTALAAADCDARIGAVVALAPAGSSSPRPGILRVPHPFATGRRVPTLYLVAGQDTSLPLDGMIELYESTPGEKRMVVLRASDHLHFMDDAESIHEAVRAMSFPPELAWLPEAMRPIGELCSVASAHAFARGLAVCHLDATLLGRAEALDLLAVRIDEELEERGIDAFEYRR